MKVLFFCLPLFLFFLGNGTAKAQNCGPNGYYSHQHYPQNNYYNNGYAQQNYYQHRHRPRYRRTYYRPANYCQQVPVVVNRPRRAYYARPYYGYQRPSIQVNIGF